MPKNVISKKESPEWWETKWAAYFEVGMSIVIGGAFSYLKPTIGIPVLVILFCISCLSLWKAYSRESITIPSLLVVLCGIVVSVGQSYLIESKQLNFATPDALSSPLLQNMNVRINDLTRENFIIRNKTFENCHIYGPAIIICSDCVIVKNSFEEVIPEGAFIETTNTTISGAVSLEHCILKNCVLHKISMIGNPEQIKDIKKGFSIFN